MYRISLLLFSCLLASLLQAQDFEFERDFIGHRAPVSHIAFRSEDNCLISGDEAGKIIVWNVENGSIRWVLHEHEDKITDLAFSPTAEQIVSASYDGTLRVWDLNTGQQLQEITNPAIPAYAGVAGDEPTFVLFDATGEWLYFGGYNQQLARVAWRSGAVESLEHLPAGGLTAACWSADGQSLFFGLLGQVHQFDLANQAIDKHYDFGNGYATYVCEVELLPNSSLLAYWAYNGKVHFINRQTGREAFALQASPQEGSSNIAFSFDGRYLVTGNDGGKTKIWDLNSRRVVQTLEGHQGEVTSFAFSDDGQQIVTAGTDQSIKLWQKRQVAPVLLANPPAASTATAVETTTPTPAPASAAASALPLENRPVEVQSTIAVQKKELAIVLWDRGQFDGDTVSIKLNGEWVVQGFPLTKTKRQLIIEVEEGDNYLVLCAENVGRIPPNTAAIAVKEGRWRTHNLSLSAGLDRSAALKITYNSR